MAGIRIEGNVTGNVAEVDSNNNLKINMPIDETTAGFVLLGGLLNDGSAFGSREVIPFAVSEEGRMNAGLDSVIFNDSFNYAAQNTTNYRYPVTTQTVTHAGGYVILNGSNITTINTNSAIQTYRSMPIYGGFGLEVRISALHTIAPPANATTEWGLLTATLPGAAIPTDGCYFRFTSAGEFRCVINYNGTEASSGPLTIPTANVNHSYEMLITEETVIFFVDGVVVYDVDTPDAFAQPFASGSVPFTARHYIGGSAPASAFQFKIGAVDINLEDMNTTKPWSHAMSGQGLSCYQGQNGGTLGSTANYANSANPTAAVPTNTTAALGTGLGGQFWETDTLAVTTDGIISSYQNPVGAPTQTPRTLQITGITISSYVQTALVGGPYVAQWSLAYGHTAVSLATAEGAIAKAPRRIGLGIQAVTAAQAVDTLLATVSYKFDTPITIYPGEFIQTVKKKVGTAPSSGVIAHVITFDGYHE